MANKAGVAAGMLALLLVCHKEAKVVDAEAGMEAAVLAAPAPAAAVPICMVTTMEEVVAIKIIK
jgi:hypothetical protein